VLPTDAETFATLEPAARIRAAKEALAVALGLYPAAEVRWWWRAAATHAISRRHVFVCFTEEEKRQAIQVLFTNATTQVDAGEGMVMATVKPVTEAVAGLAKTHIQEHLSAENRREFAKLTMDLARGAVRPVRDYEGVHQGHVDFVKAGLDTLTKKMVFQGLSKEDREEVARICLRHAREYLLRESPLLPHDPNMSIGKRARRALAKDYILAHVPPPSRPEATRLSQWKPPE